MNVKTILQNIALFIALTAAFIVMSSIDSIIEIIFFGG